MRDKIENTKGNFNPFTAYLKLHRTFLIRFALIIGIAFVVYIYVSVAGVYQDAFTGKKKLFLISPSFQKSLSFYLKELVKQQICPQNKKEGLNVVLQQRCKDIEAKLQEITRRKYKIVVVSTQQHIVTVLPETIILSKNLLLSYKQDRNDFMSFLVMMQGLFMKKIHLGDLALKNVITFIMARASPNVTTDLKMTSIYARKYSRSQIEQTMQEVAQTYNLSTNDLQTRFFRFLDNYKEKFQDQSPFSVYQRFKAIWQS